MNKAEIDLREQISNEIEAYIHTISEDHEFRQGLWKAIGVVREKIWHSPTCPCSRCTNNFKPKCRDCADDATFMSFGVPLCEPHFNKRGGQE